MDGKLDFSKATKKQLLYLIFQKWEPLTIDERYEIARELQLRQLSQDMTLELVRMYPHYDNEDIANHFGVDVTTVQQFARRLGLTERLKQWNRTA